MERPGLGALLIALLALAGVLLGGALAVDATGRMLPGDDAARVERALGAGGPGAPVMMGNSVAMSAVTAEEMRAQTGQADLVDLLLHGSGPVSWYTTYVHRARRPEGAPRAVVLVSSTSWLVHTRPASDRDLALELASWDDPLLAGFLETDAEDLGWDRRLAARLRVRDALVNLLAEPLARAALSRVEMRVPVGMDPVETALSKTFGRAGGGTARQVFLQAPGTDRRVEQRSAAEPDPAFLALIEAIRADGGRAILVLLPNRESSRVELSAEQLAESLPRGVQILDMTRTPFRWEDYADNQHFAPWMLEALSRTIAVATSVLWISPSERTLAITEHPLGATGGP